MEILNSLPKQNQNCLNITKIAPLKQSRFTFLNMRKEQGRLGSYNNRYMLCKVSGIPKCVLVWIWKRGPTSYWCCVGKQDNEVCSKQKLSLKTTQQQAIMSMSPSQSKSSTVTAETRARRGADRAPSSNKVRECRRQGKQLAAGGGCPLFSWAVTDTTLRARPFSACKTTLLFRDLSQFLSSSLLFL